MTFKQNVNELKSYITKAPVDNRDRIKQIIKLYEDRKISNFKTALNTTLTLSSKNKITISSGRPIKEYNKIINKYQDSTPITGRLKKEEEDTILASEFTFDDLNKPDTKLTVKFAKQPDGKPLNKSFSEIIATRKEKIISNVLKALNHRESIKILIRLEITVHKFEPSFDGHGEWIEKEAIFINKKATAVTKQIIQIL